MSYEPIAVFLGRALQDHNSLGLEIQEISAMSLEVVRSKTKREILDWCSTLLLPDHVGAELIKQRHAAGLRFEDDDPSLDALPSLPQNPPPPTAQPGGSARQITVKKSGGGRAKRVPLENKQRGGGNQRAGDAGRMKPGKFECGCFATVHRVQGNCLNCGRIICEQEAMDACYYCGLEPGRCVAYEIAIQEGKITEAAQQQNRALYEAALEGRDRLLDYAQNKAKRTAIIDDQQASLFAPQDAWISPGERKQAEKDFAAEERRRRIEEMHKHKGAYTVHLDFVKRNVTLGALPTAEEATKRAAATATADEEPEEVELDDQMEPEMSFLLAEARADQPSPAALSRIWYSTDGSKLEERAGPPNRKKATSGSGSEAAPPAEARNVLVVRSKRVQQNYFEDDNDVFEERLLESLEEEPEEEVVEQGRATTTAATTTAEAAGDAPAADPRSEASLIIPYAMRQRDDGICLSMHQPWASLLVHGIKMHEGRGWSTSYRGRLWIHAASQQPVDVESVKEHYAQFLKPTMRDGKGKPVTFPEHYPTKALIGSVYLMDCLDREAYEARYPPEERQEESPYSFICVEAVALSFPLPMIGNHKLFTLEHRVHVAAKKQLGEISL